MAYEIPGQLITLPASTGLSGMQFRFVGINASGQATTVGSTAGVSIVGVLQNKPVANEAATIMVSGVSKVKAVSSTVAAGDIIAASSVGYAVALAAGDYAVGRVLAGSSGGTNRVLTVLIQPIGTT